ncbi:hypothetical protein M3J09_006876 [Ascochyta lentis]
MDWSCGMVGTCLFFLRSLLEEGCRAEGMGEVMV